MNFLQSLCRLFGGRCDGEEPKPTKKRWKGNQVRILAKEAELEKTGNQMGQMGD